MPRKKKTKSETKKKRTEQLQFSSHNEKTLQRRLSIEVLKKAKKLEEKILKSGGKYVRIDKKTLILKKICVN